MGGCFFSQMYIPDIGEVREPLQVVGHRVEVDKEAAEQENWNRGHGTQEYCNLQREKQTILLQSLLVFFLFIKRQLISIQTPYTFKDNEEFD